MRLPSKFAAVALALAAFSTSAVAQVDVSLPLDAEDDRPSLALMGTIPIFWGEVDGMADIFSGAGEPHWVRKQLEDDWRLSPLDWLSEESLAPHRFLLLAQPRGFAAEENVALDEWVRGGGKVLLFADPWMTGESRFGIGDRRRPQDTVLISPILNRWGLDFADTVWVPHLTHDPSEDAIQYTQYRGHYLPMHLEGELVATGEGAGSCIIESGGLIADCEIGQGRVLVMADAAILDFEGPYCDAQSALALLMRTVFGEIAGSRDRVTVESGEWPVDYPETACPRSRRPSDFGNDFRGPND